MFRGIKKDTGLMKYVLFEMSLSAEYGDVIVTDLNSPLLNKFSA